MQETLVLLKDLKYCLFSEKGQNNKEIGFLFITGDINLKV